MKNWKLIVGGAILVMVIVYWYSHRITVVNNSGPLVTGSPLGTNAVAAYNGINNQIAQLMGSPQYAPSSPTYQRTPLPLGRPAYASQN